MPAHLSTLIMPAVLAALIVFSVYRRVRRELRRQLVRRTRLMVGIAALTVFGALFIVTALRVHVSALYIAAGLTVGLILAFYAVRHTKIEVTPEGTYYTPHLYIGLAVIALFVGRIVFRMVQVYPVMSGAVHAAGDPAAAQAMAQNPIASSLNSPLTLGVYFLMAGYYIAYNAGILRRTRVQDDAAIPSDPSP